MNEKIETKSFMSVALNKANVKKESATNSEVSEYFTLKDPDKNGKLDYTVNHLPMLMKTMNKKCKTFLSIMKELNKGKLTSTEIGFVITDLLQDERVLKIVRELTKTA